MQANSGEQESFLTQVNIQHSSIQLEPVDSKRVLEIDDSEQDEDKSQVLHEAQSNLQLEQQAEEEFKEQMIS